MSHRLTQMALLIAVASILFSVESLIETPLPWARLGLANIVTLIALYRWGLKDALILVVTRVVIGSILVGKLLQPYFVLSMIGGLASAMAMGLAIILGRKIFGFVGISIIGALIKNVTQLITASFLYVHHFILISLLPFFFITSLSAGLIVGLTALLVDLKLAALLHNIKTH